MTCNTRRNKPDIRWTIGWKGGGKCGWKDRWDWMGWDAMGWGRARCVVASCEMWWDEVRLYRSFFYYIREGSIILTGARHPCLEMQDKISFIPNDVTLTKGIEATTFLPMSPHTPSHTPTVHHSPYASQMVTNYISCILYGFYYFLR